MKILIVANWKMNPQTLIEARELFNSVKNGIKDIKNVEVVICPPFIYLPKVKSQGSEIKIGAQDCFWEEKGAFTGEISPKMLKNFGCQYVILGHSERRKYLNETDEMINKKLKAALKANLKAILCIGEAKGERELAKTKEILKRELQKDLKGIENSKFEIKNLILAYEPIWAIGSGKSCQPAQVREINLFLAKILAQRQLRGVRILYGGSVNSQNADLYLKKAQSQGLLVGGASLKANDFLKILKKVSNS